MVEENPEVILGHLAKLVHAPGHCGLLVAAHPTHWRYGFTLPLDKIDGVEFFNGEDPRKTLEWLVNAPGAGQRLMAVVAGADYHGDVQRSPAAVAMHWGVQLKRHTIVQTDSNDPNEIIAAMCRGECYAAVGNARIDLSGLDGIGEQEQASLPMSGMVPDPAPNWVCAIAKHGGTSRVLLSEDVASNGLPSELASDVNLYLTASGQLAFSYDLPAEPSPTVVDRPIEPEWSPNPTDIGGGNITIGFGGGCRPLPPGLMGPFDPTGGQPGGITFLPPRGGVAGQPPFLPGGVVGPPVGGGIFDTGYPWPFPVFGAADGGASHIPLRFQNNTGGVVPIVVRSGQLFLYRDPGGQIWQPLAVTRNQQIMVVPGESGFDVEAVCADEHLKAPPRGAPLVYLGFDPRLADVIGRAAASGRKVQEAVWEYTNPMR